MNFNKIQAAEVKLWDFSAYFWNTPRIRRHIYLSIDSSFGVTMTILFKLSYVNTNMHGNKRCLKIGYLMKAICSCGVFVK